MATLDNRYDLADLIYSDSTVAAYNAHDRLLNRAVTIELLQAPHAADTALVTQLVDKGRAAALSSLPNVAAVYDQQAVDGRPFLVLEEVAGPALGAVAPLPLEQTVTLVCELATTVQAAFRRNLPLPALNLDTVRIGLDDRIQVLDFGLQERRATPEQALAALGGLLQTALGGGAETRLSGPVREIADRALRGQYATADTLAADLRALLQRAEQPTTVLGRTPATVPIDDLGAVNTRTSATPAVEPARRRGVPLTWIAAAGAILLVVVLASLFVRGGSGGDPGADENTAASIAPSAVTTSAPPAAASQPVGEPYVVAARGNGTVRVRTGPGLAAQQIASLPNGTVVQVLSPPQAADGYNWVQISGGGVEGWCIVEALRKQ